MTTEEAAAQHGLTADALREIGEALGLDVVGAAAVAPYTDTEEHIRERRERGLFGAMRFTMAQPEVSCHPEALLEGARTVVSAALCYYTPGPEPRSGEGRLPRYAWRDHYALLRERLDALGRRLGGSYRVLVDANQHVDRAGAERAGVGFIGKNTMLITRTHGSWVVLGTLVTDVVLEPTPPVAAGCGSCTLCIDACPTDALCGDEPGVLDATRCLSYWTQTAGEMPDEVMDALDDRVYGCDICQDVCPWNTGPAARRAAEALPEDAQPTISLVDWLTRGPEELGRELEHLFVPRNDYRWLRRNALIALGNVGDADDAALAEPFLDDPEPALRAAAGRAVSRLTGRT
jgi:epoxyqueuosine reductase